MTETSDTTDTSSRQPDDVRLILRYEGPRPEEVLQALRACIRAGSLGICFVALPVDRTQTPIGNEIFVAFEPRYREAAMEMIQQAQAEAEKVIGEEDHRFELAPFRRTADPSDHATFFHSVLDQLLAEDRRKQRQ